MDRSEFEDCLDRYGGDIARWPDAVRPAAERLLATDARARAALAAMREIEGVLQAPAVDVAHGHELVAARAMRHAQQRARPFFSLSAGWSAAAAAALVLGVLVGDLTPRVDDNPDRVMSAALEPSGDVDGE